MPAPGVCMTILEARHKQDGSGSFNNPVKVFDQDYEQIKEWCLVHNKRWIDSKFPPDQYSIGDGLLQPQDLARVKWQRPHNIAPNPAFILDGISRFDFGQGQLGNCWFLASIGALTFRKEILFHIVPQEQAFDGKYCGIFHFRFWRYGKWIDVTIDDKLPTLNGQLIFVKSRDKNEFWPALLEKAYAKVCGSYTDMKAGTPVEAMRDFTGGVHMQISLSNPPADLWELMIRVGQCSSLMGCGTQKGETSENTTLDNGLVQGHAYTVTGVQQLMSQNKLVKLLRLWNPWGKGEWNGNWSDRSPLWHTVSAEDRELLSVADDGEFWMSLEDFCKFYTDLDICSTSPKFLDGSSSDHWKSSTFEGRWVAGTTAGGRRKHKDTFWTNPQYRVTIDSNYLGNDGKKNVLVSLMQKSDKRNRNMVEKFFIGLSVFEVKEKDKGRKGKFPASFFSTQAPVYETQSYPPTREMMERLNLNPGEYLIVPNTFEQQETAAFILTILSKGEIHGYETSGDFGDEPVKVLKDNRSVQDEENKITVSRQHSSEFKELDAEQLQMLLNEKILEGDLKHGGFSIDACRSMVALMDTSITGKLNSEEFYHLWKKVLKYREIFFRTDVSKTKQLSLSELRNAFIAADIKVSDDMLNLMAVRYGAANGQMTLESFISLIMRFSCMNKIFSQLSVDGRVLNLQKPDWLYISMYT